MIDCPCLGFISLMFFLWPLSWKIGIKTPRVLLKIFWYFYDVLYCLTCQMYLNWAQNHFLIERSRSIFTQVPFSLNLGHSKCFYKNKLFNDILNIYISLILYFLKLIIDIQNIKKNVFLIERNIFFVLYTLHYPDFEPKGYLFYFKINLCAF